MKTSSVAKIILVGLSLLIIICLLYSYKREGQSIRLDRNESLIVVGTFLTTFSLILRAILKTNKKYRGLKITQKSNR